MADRLPLPHILAAVIQPKLNCSLGYEPPSSDVRVTSGLSPITDIRRMGWHVRKAPFADIGPINVPKCLSGNFSLKTLDESRHGLPHMLLSGTSFNFAIWKSESNQTHVSGRTLRDSVRKGAVSFYEQAQ